MAAGKVISISLDNWRTRTNALSRDRTIGSNIQPIGGAKTDLLTRLAGDRCGCAMGGRFLAAGLAGSIAWFAWSWHFHALGWGYVSWRVFAVSFAAAVIGKVLGIVLFRLKSKRSFVDHSRESVSR